MTLQVLALTILTILKLCIALDYNTKIAQDAAAFDTEKTTNIVQEEYNSEKNFENRADHVINVCKKYADPNRPESFNISNYQERNTGINVFLGSTPSHNFCIPTFTFEKEFLELSKSIKSDSDIKKGKATFNTLFVMHPFRRLAKAFLDLEKQTEFKSALEKYAGQMSFNNFVQFILRGNREGTFEGLVDVNTKRLLLDYLPYHFACPVCLKGQSPNFVLKLDLNFEREFEDFMEDFGFDELTEVHPYLFNAVPSSREIKKLYSQLNVDLLDELTHKYRIDFEMFRYSPYEFYP